MIFSELIIKKSKIMSKPTIKPKATIAWSKQTEKLKKKFSALAEKDLYFEDGKLEEMLSKLQEKMGTSNHELFGIIVK